MKFKIKPKLSNYLRGAFYRFLSLKDAIGVGLITIILFLIGKFSNIPNFSFKTYYLDIIKDLFCYSLFFVFGLFCLLLFFSFVKYFQAKKMKIKYIEYFFNEDCFGWNIGNYSTNIKKEDILSIKINNNFIAVKTKSMKNGIYIIIEKGTFKKINSDLLNSDYIKFIKK